MTISTPGAELRRLRSLLALFTFLSAATNELYRPAMNAAIADVVPFEHRARAWGLAYWAMNLGWTFGLALGGAIAARSFTALFLTDAATTLAFAAIVARRVPETRPTGTHVHSPLAGLARVFGDGTFVVFLVLNLVALVVFVQFQLAAPVDMNAHGVGPGTFAALLSINGLGVVVLQPLLGPTLARKDLGRLLAASALLIGCGFGVNALAGWLPPLPVYLAGVVLWTMGEVVGFPAGATVVANLSPPELRGRYQGAFSMSWGVARMDAAGPAPAGPHRRRRRTPGHLAGRGRTGAGSLVDGPRPPAPDDTGLRSRDARPVRGVAPGPSYDAHGRALRKPSLRVGRALRRRRRAGLRAVRALH